MRTAKILLPLLLIIGLTLGGYFFVDITKIRQPKGVAAPTLAPEAVTQGIVTATAAHAAAPAAMDEGRSWYALFFTDPEKRRQRRGGFDDALAADIASAARSVDVSSFVLDLASVSDALIAAHERGVKVRVVSDTEGAEVTDRSAATIKRLQDAGIPVVLDARDALMHNKFAVVDGGIVWTGSANYTSNDAYLNDNNVLRLTAPEFAADYSARFEELAAGRFGREARRNTPYPVVELPGETRVAVYFSPEGGARSAIQDRLAKAQRSIRLMAYTLTDTRQVDLLIEKHRQGIPVQVVVDKNNRGAAAARLAEAGIEVLSDGNCFAMHHKVYVIDDRTVITGSYNFTASAERFNDENLLIMDDPALAARYLAEFERVRAQALAPADCR